MKKTRFTLVLAIVLAVSMMLPAMALGEAASANAGREQVNIRFAQFGNSVDDEVGMQNDPIIAAIEEAVNITLEYDNGTEGFERAHADRAAYRRRGPTCSPPGARARRLLPGRRRSWSMTWRPSSTPNPNAGPRCTRYSTARSTRPTTSSTPAMKTRRTPSMPWPPLPTRASAAFPCTTRRFSTPSTRARLPPDGRGVHRPSPRPPAPTATSAGGRATTS